MYIWAGNPLVIDHPQVHRIKLIRPIDNPRPTPMFLPRFGEADTWGPPPSTTRQRHIRCSPPTTQTPRRADMWPPPLPPRALVIHPMLCASAAGSWQPTHTEVSPLLSRLAFTHPPLLLLPPPSPQPRNPLLNPRIFSPPNAGDGAVARSEISSPPRVLSPSPRRPVARCC